MASAWKQASGVAALVKAGVTRTYAQEETSPSWERYTVH